MDLIREILLKLEECDFTGLPHPIQIDGHSEQEISYHIQLLHEAGFIHAVSGEPIGAPFPEWEAVTITWDGHEFLDSARDPGRWEKAKKLVVEKGTGLTIEALKIAFSEMIKSAFK